MIDDPANLQSESPQVFAKRIGIQKKSRSGTGSTATLSWDECLDLAVISYWEQRGTTT